MLLFLLFLPYNSFLSISSFSIHPFFSLPSSSLSFISCLLSETYLDFDLCPTFLFSVIVSFDFISLPLTTTPSLKLASFHSCFFSCLFFNFSTLSSFHSSLCSFIYHYVPPYLSPPLSLCVSFSLSLSLCPFYCPFRSPFLLVFFLLYVWQFSASDSVTYLDCSPGCTEPSAAVIAHKQLRRLLLKSVPRATADEGTDVASFGRRMEEPASTRETVSSFFPRIQKCCCSWWWRRL